MRFLGLSKKEILLLNLTMLAVLIASAPLWLTVNKTPDTITKNTKISTSSVNTLHEFVKVKRVIDGDTFVLEDEQKVRLIGIDAPEMNYKTGNPECGALKAKLKLQELTENKTVRLEKDLSDKDKYGRLLRYVYVDNTFVNAELVRLGLAQVKHYKPDTAKYHSLKEIEKQAKNNKLGIWSDECRK